MDFPWFREHSGPMYREVAESSRSVVLNVSRGKAYNAGDAKGVAAFGGKISRPREVSS